MFSHRELLLIKQSLDSLRVDLVKIHSACREVDLSVDRIKKELKEVEDLTDKVNSVLKKKAESVWGVAKDLCLNPELFK